MKKRIPWNKGLTKEEDPRIKKSGFQPGHIGFTFWKNKKIYPHMKKALLRASIGRTPYNKGVFSKNTSYSAIHKYLVRNFGKANFCINIYCNHTSIRFDYALIKGRKYTHDINDYIRLCRKCHLAYDSRKKNYHNKDNVIKGINQVLKK